MEIKKLFIDTENPWNRITKTEKSKIDAFAEQYITFLNNAKTERESVKEIEKIIKKKGFKEISKFRTLKPNDKVYKIIRNKSIYTAVIGKKPIFKGVVSHIDSPRIDLKPKPLIEDSNLSILKTQYYGGIKKYQWVNRSLSLHGVILTKNKKIELKIGENPKDPVFLISDLLPHLATEQMKKTMNEGVKGKSLNIIVGNMPLNSKDKELKEKIKANTLKILYEKYGITEEDLISAEIEVTPADKARIVGFDKSMVIGYGQDDKSCAYTSLRAILETENPKNTALALFVDKEEIGSEGNTTAKTKSIYNFLYEILKKSNPKQKDEINTIIEQSQMLSADVTAAVNPDYKEVHDLSNAAYLGKGVAIEKYTSNTGKYMSNDANAEFVNQIRQLLNKNKIIWQSSALGEVDSGGGGTVAIYFAQMGFEVLDIGIAVLGMHSPAELSSTLDLYQAYKAYKVFLNEG